MIKHAKKYLDLVLNIKEIVNLNVLGMEIMMKMIIKYALLLMVNVLKYQIINFVLITEEQTKMNVNQLNLIELMVMVLILLLNVFIPPKKVV